MIFHDLLKKNLIYFYDVTQNKCELPDLCGQDLQLQMIKDIIAKRHFVSTHPRCNLHLLNGVNQYCGR